MKIKTQVNLNHHGKAEMTFSKPILTRADKVIVLTLVTGLVMGTIAPRAALAITLALPFGVFMGWELALWPRLFANLRPDCCELPLPIVFIAYAPIIAIGEPYRLSIAHGFTQLALTAFVTAGAAACVAGGVKELLEPDAVTRCIAKWWAERVR